MNECDFKNIVHDPSKLKVIGAGGFGTVYKIDEKRVLKAIVSPDACQDAFLELQKQRKAYDAFQKLSNFNGQFINKVQKYVKVSRPFQSCREVVVIDSKKYSCYFVMERLYGLHTKVLEDIDSNFRSSMEKDYDPKAIMLQLSYNSDLPSRVYGINYAKKLVGDKNPPRGYFINESSVIIKKLQKYGSQLNDNEIKEIIGFIYGYLFFQAKLIPIDIEITLGFHDGRFVINVLDFGMTIDLDDLSNLPILPRTSRFINILNSDLSEENKLLKLEELTIQELSIELYCDLEDDKSCERGWLLAKSL